MAANELHNFISNVIRHWTAVSNIFPMLTDAQGISERKGLLPCGKRDERSCDTNRSPLSCCLDNSTSTQGGGEGVDGKDNGLGLASSSLRLPLWLCGHYNKTNLYLYHFDPFGCCVVAVATSAVAPDEILFIERRQPFYPETSFSTTIHISNPASGWLCA